MTTTSLDLTPLRTQVTGWVGLRGSDGFDDAGAGFQTGVAARPLAVVEAADAADVAAAVRFAAARGLPVGVQATGHGLCVPADDGILITTRRMDDVRIDAARRTARIGAGVRWEKVIAAAARSGLAPVSGSSPHVGAVGYTLSGGYGLLGRAFGFAADLVRTLDVVTADGRRRTVTSDVDPDLFWALRGGRDNVGVVTAMEIDLVPVERIVGGGLYFDVGDAPALIPAFTALADAAPDTLSLSFGMVGLPDVPFLPAPVRGRHVLHVRVAALTDAADAARSAVDALRRAGTVLHGEVTEMPFTDSGAITGDPSWAHAYDGTNVLVDRLDAGALADVARLAGPDSAVPCVLDVRLLGGAFARPAARPSAVPFREAGGLVRVLSATEGADVHAVRAAHNRVLAALGAPVGRAVGFVYGRRDRAEEVGLYDPATAARLRAIKQIHDPDAVFRATHALT